MSTAHDPTGRFSDRVADYARYRPRYPRALIPLLQREIGLTPAWRIADIGLGTGISAEPFLHNGNEVVGVEPNTPMRSAAEQLLADQPRFTSRSGTAEETGLPSSSFDLVLAGQAFHWFDQERAGREFRRILKPDGWVVLLWNRRLVDGTPFLRACEDLVTRYGTDYQQIRHDRMNLEAVRPFFGGTVMHHVLPNTQVLDLDGLTGRLLSSSYLPGPGDPTRAHLINGIRRLFTDHQRDGHVHMEYETDIYAGRFAGAGEGEGAGDERS